MNCVICKKEIDTKVNTLPASWFGAFIGSKVKAVICLSCIRKQGPAWAEKVQVS